MVTAELKKYLKMPHFDHFPLLGKLTHIQFGQDDFQIFKMKFSVTISWEMLKYFGSDQPFQNIWAYFLLYGHNIRKWMKVKVIWLDLTGDYESFDRLSGSIFVEKHKTIAFFCT